MVEFSLKTDGVSLKCYHFQLRRELKNSRALRYIVKYRQESKIESFRHI
jgi:hypothetical protein